MGREPYFLLRFRSPRVRACQVWKLLFENEWTQRDVSTVVEFTFAECPLSTACRAPSKAALGGARKIRAG